MIVTCRVTHPGATVPGFSGPGDRALTSASSSHSDTFGHGKANDAGGQVGSWNAVEDPAHGGASRPTSAVFASLSSFLFLSTGSGSGDPAGTLFTDGNTDAPNGVGQARSAILPDNEGWTHGRHWMSRRFWQRLKCPILFR